MTKGTLEAALDSKLSKGWIPQGIHKPTDSGKMVVIQKEGEDNRITMMFRTLDTDDRKMEHQFIYSLDEAEYLLKED